MKNNKRKISGQTMTEYIIIVAVVALAAIAIFAVFGDTIRQKMSGAVKELDSGQNASAADAAVSQSSHDYLKNLNKDGAGTGN